MDTNQLIMGSIAFFGTIGLVLGMALTVHWGKNRDTGLMPYLFYPGLLSAAFFALTSHRDLTAYVDLLKASAPPEKNMASAWVGRIVSIFILFAFSERVLHRLFSKEKSRQVPGMLLFGLVVFFLSNVICPGLFGSHPSLTHENFYAMIACLAALLMNDKEASLLFNSARNAMFLFLLAGLILIPLVPSLVIANNYSGLIPLLNVRLSGLTNHPNALGALSIGYILCVWKFPFQNRLLNRTAWIVGMLSLILSQSKTSWIAFLCSAGFIIYFTYASQFKQYFLNHRRPFLSLFLIASVMLGILGTFIAFSFMDLGDHINHFFNSRTGSDLLTLTGRDIIWQVALEEWHKSPIFGYGLTIWDDDFRRSIQMGYATSAHSQFYQSLSSAGLVGVTGLFVYFSILLYYSLSAAKQSGGLTMALLTVIAIGCFSEAGFVLGNFDAQQCMEHILLLVLLAVCCQPEKKKQFASQRSPNLNNKKGWA